MAEIQYTNERLVSLYDSINKWGKDNDFYVEISGNAPVRILDAGCGTGMLAIKLAQKGHFITGIDPSIRMIEAAREKDNKKLVKWVVSTIENFEDIKKFDLIIMTGHAFQCLLNDNDIIKAFKSVANLLNTNGKFVFETRNPVTKPWEKWTQENTRRNVKHFSSDFEIYHQLIGVHGENVTFETRYIFNDNSDLTSLSTLRFAPLKKIEKLMNQSGLFIDSIYGNWDQSDFTKESKEIIIKAFKPD